VFTNEIDVTAADLASRQRKSAQVAVRAALRMTQYRSAAPRLLLAPCASLFAGMI